MKRRSILFILFLLLTLFTCIGCSSGESAPSKDLAAIPEEASEILEEQAAANSLSNAEDVSGIFEGLEDNHTALFSFDGVESAFFFEDPAVKNVLSEAVIGSTYTLSYSYDSSTGLNVIYKISE